MCVACLGSCIWDSQGSLSQNNFFSLEQEETSEIVLLFLSFAKKILFGEEIKSPQGDTRKSVWCQFYPVSSVVPFSSFHFEKGWNEAESCKIQRCSQTPYRKDEQMDSKDTESFQSMCTLSNVGILIINNPTCRQFMS